MTTAEARDTRYDRPGMGDTGQPAWDELHRTIRAYVGRRVRNPADAEDVVQRVFLRLHRGLDTLRDDERLLAWIYAAARNAVTDHYRAAARVREAAIGDASAFDDVASDAPDEATALATLASCVPPLLAHLPAADQEALRLTEVDGLTQADAAARLGLSISGMKSRVQRARKRLKGVVEACCRVELDRRGGVVSYEPREGAACGDCGDS